MKKPVLGLVVALVLCTWNASQASAQTAELYANRAVNWYNAALSDVNNAYNAARNPTVKSTLSTAYTQLLYAYNDADNAAYYYSIGNFGMGDEAADLAYSHGAAAISALDTIPSTANQTVQLYVTAALAEAGNGDYWIDEAQWAPN
jgi:hypothetical protein